MNAGIREQARRKGAESERRGRRRGRRWKGRRKAAINEGTGTGGAGKKGAFQEDG